MTTGCGVRRPYEESNMTNTPLLKELALAILTEDWVAAYAAADILAENREKGLHPWPALQKLATPGHRIMAAFMVDPEVTKMGGTISIDHQSVQDAFYDWIEKGGPLLLEGIHLTAVFERPFPNDPIKAAVEAVMLVGNSQRWNVFKHFCLHCHRSVSEGETCHCANDE